MILEELPTDIIVTLPFYLDSLDDLYALIRTSKTFYVACADTTATFPPRFAKLHGQRLFMPHPHLLVGGNARKVANWAVQSTSNRSKLTAALKGGGIDGLYALTVDVARMSLTDARELYSAKYNILNPLTRAIDLEAGPANRAKTYAEDGRTLDDDQEWWTILEYPELTLLNHWIYCELFHHTITNAYDSSDVEPLSTETRWDFLSYCVPDCNNKRVRVPTKIMNQAIEYAESPWHTTTVACFMLIQQYLYRETEFSVHGIAQRVGPANKKDGEGNGEKDANKESEERDEFFHEVILHQGLLAMRLVLPGGVDATRDEVDRIREKIVRLPESRVCPEYEEYDEETEEWIPNDELWKSMNEDCSQLIWNSRW